MMHLPLPKLHGHHQIDNVGLACVALLNWRDDWPQGAFAEGIASATWPARLQPLTRGALSAPIRALGGEVWVDGGHNAHAAEVLARALGEMKAKRGGETVAIIGLRKRKDAAAFINAIARGVDHIITMPLSDEHISPEDVAALAQRLGIRAAHAPSLSAAMQNAALLPAPRVLICGSFLLAAEALAAESA